MKDKELSTEWLNNLYKYLSKVSKETTGGLFGWANDIEVEEDGELKYIDPPTEDYYEIVDEPQGDIQEFSGDLDKAPAEYREFLTCEYCDQFVNGGYSGDEYQGYMYYPLPNKKYMKVYYSC